MALLSLLAILLASLVSQLCGFRLQRQAEIRMQLDGNTSMLNSDTASKGHIICPVLNALVQNGDMKTMEDGVDADTVINSLMRAGLNQPEYSGDPLPTGITQSNAFEYTFGIFLKNKAGNYRDSNGNLTLPVYDFPGTNHEHNSQTGITTKKGIPFDNTRWEMLAAQADQKLANGRDCFSRDAWANALLSFESRDYNGSGSREIDNSKVRPGHAIKEGGATWGGSWLVGKLLSNGAENGNAIKSKRLVAGVSQVFNGMINLFWTGDYGHLELYKARAKQFETDEGKAGLSFPWLDESFCLPVDELKALLVDGTYPKSSGYNAMTVKEYQEKNKVWKFPISRCTAAYFQEGQKGYEPENACIDGEPPLVDKESWAKRTALHTLFGKR